MVLAAAALAACQQQKTADDNKAAAEAAPGLPGVPLPQPPLNRKQLLLAAMRSASDFAAGVDDSRRQKDLAEKRFEFRIRFGCEGPVSDRADPPFGWSLNRDRRTLRVVATPMLSPEDASVEAINNERFEVVEGFWIQRPWLLSPTCPKPDQPAGDQAAEPENATAANTADEAASETAGDSEVRTVGIAQFFTATDPRTMRRSGRPYEATTRLDEGDTPAGGFDLILTGRLKPLPDGRVIACTRSSSGERPSCLISVEFERVSIERADTREELAHWRSG